MKIIWKGDPAGADDAVFRVLLDVHGGVYVEELSMDLIGGDRWSIVRRESVASHVGFNDRWLRAVSAAIASLSTGLVDVAKEAGR